MPYIHHYSLNVRHYECDAHGRLHTAALLGYLQEAAFDASAAVGWSAARYAAESLQWLAYETEIMLLYPAEQPPGYADALTVRTWVADMRRVRSLRRYEVYRGEALVAQASTDWVLIDAVKHLPVSIPPQVVSDYAQGETTPSTDQRPPFPRFPATPPDAFTLRRRVEWRDIDPAAHVNNAVYLHYATEALRQAGLAAAFSRYQIEYKLAAVLDDEVAAHAWSEADGACCCVMTRAADGKTLARVRAWA